MSTTNENRTEKIFVTTKALARTLIQSSDDLIQISRALTDIAGSVSKTDLDLALHLADLGKTVLNVSDDISRANKSMLDAWLDTE